ncbi:MAG: hypothetical protein L0Z63_02975 [Actinobacteria bacterium]|nr:hypothetical protein [Actinomycetota bacterium]
MIGGFMQMLDNRETGVHDGPAPQPRCTCGIYAEKPDEPGRADIPRLVRLPQVRGPVELSGVVIEGKSGYRGQRARLVGPLELQVPCFETMTREACPNPAVAALMSHETPRGVCAVHADPSENNSSLDLTDWLDRISPQIQTIYQTPVFTFEEGGQTHGHR